MGSFLQLSIVNLDVTTAVSGTAKPNYIRKGEVRTEPLDLELLAEVQATLARVHNLGHTEGLRENK
ncbi:MAG: hypothetical protein ACR2M4_12940 [Actinomycetota bacterium]